MPYKIAIVGGIGSGKSVVSRLFRLMGVPVYDCDAEAKRLMNINIPLRFALIHAFGDQVYGDDGTLNRSYLSSCLFGCPERVALVNSIVHPVVRSDFKAWTLQSRSPIVAVETAILYEAKMDSDVDSVLLIHAPSDLRLHRAVQRDKTGADAIRRRMDNQMSDEDLLHRATYVIVNDGSSSLVEQVEMLLLQIKEEIL